MSLFCRLIRMFMVQLHTFMKNIHVMVESPGVSHLGNVQWLQPLEDGDEVRLRGSDEKLILRIVSKMPRRNARLSSVRLYFNYKILFHLDINFLKKLAQVLQFEV